MSLEISFAIDQIDTFFISNHRYILWSLRTLLVHTTIVIKGSCAVDYAASQIFRIPTSIR
jgi:hypothetical protein